jgi:hypothetical protein
VFQAHISSSSSTAAKQLPTPPLQHLNQRITREIRAKTIRVGKITAAEHFNSFDECGASRGVFARDRAQTSTQVINTS